MNISNIQKPLLLFGIVSSVALVVVGLFAYRQFGLFKNMAHGPGIMMMGVGGGTLLTMGVLSCAKFKKEMDREVHFGIIVYEDQDSFQFWVSKNFNFLMWDWPTTRHNIENFPQDFDPKLQLNENEYTVTLSRDGRAINFIYFFKGYRTVVELPKITAKLTDIKDDKSPGIKIFLSGRAAPNQKKPKFISLSILRERNRSWRSTVPAKPIPKFVGKGYKI